jgi:GntR family transcriptional regulator
MLNLDLQSRIPIFEQIKAGLARLIYLGALAADEQLPSVRALAEQLAVNPNTVQKAYAQLEAIGLIYSVSGRGNFVRPGLSGCRQEHEQLQEKLRRLGHEAREAGFPESMAVLIIRDSYSGRGEQHD